MGADKDESDPDACKEQSDLPLMLTPLIENNQTERARQLSLVDATFLEDFVPPSHAGYLTVDQQLGNHMFFWFFPSQSNPDNAPLILWLNGGPTVPSMFGLFHENGPMAVDKKTSVPHGRPRYNKRLHSWTGPFSMLYVDNPINTGFSFSDSGSQGDTFTEEKCAQNLYNVLEQFLKVFPEYKELEIYIGGQSYAGMFTISLAHYILNQVKQGKKDVTISGIHLGGPYFDPETQIPKLNEFLYHMGGISYKTYVDNVEDLTKLFQIDKDYIIKAGVNLLDIYRLLFIPPAEDNFVTREPPPYYIVGDLMNSLDVKRAVHAGRRRTFSTTFSDTSIRVLNKFTEDALTSRVDKLAQVLDSGDNRNDNEDNKNNNDNNKIKVLIYNGNLDAIIPSVSIEAGLMRTPWSKQAVYNDSLRHEWVVGVGVGGGRGGSDGGGGSSSQRFGFYTRVGNLCRVVINGAGHQVPYDRPEAALRMMEDFVTHGCVGEQSRDDEKVKVNDSDVITQEPEFVADSRASQQLDDNDDDVKYRTLKQT